MINRAAKPQTQAKLRQLLDLWHGDENSMGWMSPTLALNIAYYTQPTSVLALTCAIYGEERATKIHNSNDFSGDYREIRRIVREGFHLYNRKLNNQALVKK